MDWYRDYLTDTGRSAAVWALVSFVVTFAVTRGITRRIRAKKSAAPAESDKPAAQDGLSDIYIGGVHVHHQVWGILLVLLSGMLQIRYSPESPWSEVLAAVFGAGAALTLDEFALWFHLDDVYWGPEGRKSIDAILLGGALGVVLLMQASPLGERAELTDWYALFAYLGGLAFHLAMAAVCFLKSKLPTGAIGIVVPLVAFVGAVRLAKPNSVWARRRYGHRKLERARRRFGAAYEHRWDRIRDLVGGSPHAPTAGRRPDHAGRANQPGPHP